MAKSRRDYESDDRSPISSTQNSFSQNPFSAHQHPKNGLHLPEIDLLPGELIYFCCPAQIELIQLKDADPFDGKFFATNFKVIKHPEEEINLIALQYSFHSKRLLLII